MEYLIGAAVGLGVCIFTSLVGMDRDRALYPAMLIVIALLYDLFAAMGGSNQALIMEFAAGVVFIGLAVAGFRSTLWFTVIGLIGHGIFDLWMFGESRQRLADRRVHLPPEGVSVAARIESPQDRQRGGEPRRVADVPHRP